MAKYYGDLPCVPNGIRIQFWEKLNGKRKNHTRITETRLDNPKIAGSHGENKNIF